MIRLAYSSARSGERSATFDKPVIRFGSAPGCDVRIDSDEVAAEHGQFVLRGGAYHVVELDSRSGLWLDGKRARRLEIRGGERIRLGSPEGPEIRVAQVLVGRGAEGPPEESEATLLADPRWIKQVQAGAVPKDGSPPPLKRTPSPVKPTSAPPVRVPALTLQPTQPPRRPTRPPQRAESAPLMLEPLTDPGGAAPSPGFKAKGGGLRRLFRRLKRPHEEVQHWLVRAQREISQARKLAQGASSGHTMVIMARALSGLRQTAEGRTRRWRRTLAAVGLLSVMAMGGLSGVIFLQHKRIKTLVSQKAAIDKQIQSLFAQMATETDETRLADLEARLEVLMGEAAKKLTQVSKAGPARAEVVEEPADPLEQEIRKILKSFHADTYAIPPIFKQALQEQISELQANRGLSAAYARKQRYWPLIQRALQQKQLPEELGYIAYTESHFDPSAVNGKSHATGMWQLMEDVARPCGIVVRSSRDDRLDPGRSSSAAACYLSKLLIEFGEESFMLALASYNRGENGVRRALHKVAKEPGGYRKRDFWHLYRMKLLPEETREYVPRVLAAAIVFGNPEKYGLVPPTQVAAAARSSPAAP